MDQWFVTINKVHDLFGQRKNYRRTFIYISFNIDQHKHARMQEHLCATYVKGML